MSDIFDDNKRFEVKLDEIAEQVNERVTPLPGDEEKFIGLQHLVSGSLQIRNWGDEVVLSAQAFRVKKGDIIFARRNTYLKRIAISPIDGLCSADAIVIRQKGDKLLPGILPFLLQSEYFLESAISLSAGSLSARVKWKDLKNIKFKVPSLEQQERIVPILRKLHTTTNTYENMAYELNKLRNLLLSKTIRGLKGEDIGEWDKRVGHILPGYSVVKLEELLSNKSNCMRSGPFGSALKKEQLSDSGTPLLGIDNVFNEDFVDDYKRFVPDKLFEKFKKFEVFPGDVMITIMGTVGRACVFPATAGRALSSKHLWTMTFDSYPPELIAWQLNYAPWVKHHFARYSQGGIMEAISSKVLKSCPIVLPPNDEIENLNKLSITMKRLPESFFSVLDKKKKLITAIVGKPY